MPNNINEMIKKSVLEYEKKFNEKAPPMEVIVGAPGVFSQYIKKLDEAVQNGKPIQWDKDFDYNSIVF